MKKSFVRINSWANYLCGQREASSVVKIIYSHLRQHSGVQAVFLPPRTQRGGGKVEVLRLLALVSLVVKIICSRVKIQR
jgi:hypothetical protein